MTVNQVLPAETTMLLKEKTSSVACSQQLGGMRIKKQRQKELSRTPLQASQQVWTALLLLVLSFPSKHGGSLRSQPERHTAEASLQDAAAGPDSLTPFSLRRWTVEIEGVTSDPTEYGELRLCHRWKGEQR